MKLENLISNLEMTVEMYAKLFYDWNQHIYEEKQSTEDFNKLGGFIKTFEDNNKRRLYILKSKTSSNLIQNQIVDFSEKSILLLNDLEQKEFYFCAILEWNHSIEDLFYPNEIFLTLEEAEQSVKRIFSLL